MRIQVTLTTTESKRIISKAVAKVEVVQNALKNGIIILKKGTTNVFLLQELVGNRREVRNYCCGINVPKGACISNDSYENIQTHEDKRIPMWVLKKGKVHEEVPDLALKEMDCDDVFISGANALDSDGQAAMMVIIRGAGSIGRHLPVVMSQGIKHIIPVGLEKLIPTSVNRTVLEGGLTRIKHAMGRPYAMIPLHGQVITEVEATKILTGATAIPLAAGGVLGAEGAIHLLIKGNDENVERAWDLISRTIKGARLPELSTPNCETCKMPCRREDMHYGYVMRA